MTTADGIERVIRNKLFVGFQTQNGIAWVNVFAITAYEPVEIQCKHQKGLGPIEWEKGTNLHLDSGTIITVSGDTDMNRDYVQEIISNFNKNKYGNAGA